MRVLFFYTIIFLELTFTLLDEDFVDGNVVYNVKRLDVPAWESLDWLSWFSIHDKKGLPSATWFLPFATWSSHIFFFYFDYVFPWSVSVGFIVRK